jgi:hypothetical protein
VVYQCRELDIHTHREREREREYECVCESERESGVVRGIDGRRGGEGERQQRIEVILSNGVLSKYVGT